MGLIIAMFWQAMFPSSEEVIFVTITREHTHTNDMTFAKIEFAVITLITSRVYTSHFEGVHIALLHLTPTPSTHTSHTSHTSLPHLRPTTPTPPSGTDSLPLPRRSGCPYRTYSVGGGEGRGGAG